MSSARHKLHEQLIRLAKGMIKAWEEWLEEDKKRSLDLANLDAFVGKVKDCLKKDMSQ